MAVRSFRSSSRNTGRRAALFAALAVLTLPGVALADTDEGDRGGRRQGGGEARSGGETQSDGAGRGNRDQPRQSAAQQQQPPRPEPVQRGWRGPSSTGWTPPAAPAGQTSAAPNARGNTGWGNRGSDDNGRRPRGDHDGERGRGPGDASTGVATPAPGWRGPVRRTDDRHVETPGVEARGVEARGDDHRGRDGGYRDGHRDGRSTDSWRGGNNDRWRGDRDRNHDRSGYGDNHHRWDHDWRHNNRYNWHSYRNHNRDIFRWGSYYSPYRNYSYRRLSIGFFLNSLFYGNRYWINDPWQYRLPDAYGPYRWVRYYDDALLVDIYSGEVVDVINNFFW